MRQALGLALIGLFGVFLWTLTQGSNSANAAPAQFTSSTQCFACHAEQAAEWQRGQHSGSWTGPEVRRLSGDFSNQDCIDCHAPEPVFVTGIGERVQPRTLRRPEGVDCLTCHALPEGGVAASFTNPGAPCSPVEKVDLARADLCVGCHNQHKTVEQWRGSNYFEQRVSCIDCHMPPRGGDPKNGRDHAMCGGSDPEMVRAAVDLEVRSDGGDGWIATVINGGVGHSFPTDERSRAADLFWRPAGGAEEAPWEHFYRFRSPYRDETELEDTLLLVHESREVPVLDHEQGFLGSGGPAGGVPARGPIEVLLVYKRSPFYEDWTRPLDAPDAIEVHRVQVPDEAAVPR
jgi:hypothetical protein